MATISELYGQALLADVSYAIKKQTSTEEDLAEQIISMRSMPTSLAIDFAKDFALVANIDTDDILGSGFDASLFRGKDNSLNLAIRGTEGLQDFLTDAELALTGDAGGQVIDMVNWWLRLTAAKGEPVQQFAVTYVVENEYETPKAVLG